MAKIKKSKIAIVERYTKYQAMKNKIFAWESENIKIDRVVVMKVETLVSDTQVQLS